MSKYAQAATLTISTGQERKDILIARAMFISEINGKNPNISAVTNELIDIGIYALALFGEDWKDQLAMQSEPLWAKGMIKKLVKIVDLIEALSTTGIKEQAEMIEEIRTDMDIEGMLE